MNPGSGHAGLKFGYPNTIIGQPLLIFEGILAKARMPLTGFIDGLF